MSFLACYSFLKTNSDAWGKNSPIDFPIFTIQVLLNTKTWEVALKVPGTLCQNMW